VKLLDSLLDAIVRLEGDALVMHVGEKPYVVTASATMNAYRGPLAWGQVELSSRVLTFDAVSTMLSQILPLDQRQALDEFGAIEHEIPSPSGIVDRFTVVAARGGEDVWVEVRRKPVEVAQAPEPAAQVPEQAAPELEQPVPPVEQVAPAVEQVAPVAEEPPAPVAQAPEHVEPEPVAIEAAAPATSTAEYEPIAQPEPDLADMIVMALPGDLAAEVPLDSVPDNAIQIVDDEPQGVPTEDEVDAMLAATAAALLTSGLGPEYEIREPADAYEPVGVSAPELAELVSHTVSDPTFELTPPPLVARVDEEAEEDELVLVTPGGTPLFSEEAMLAAAAQPTHDAIADQGRVQARSDTPPAAAPVQVFREAAPELASGTVEIVPTVPPVDLAAQVAVWSNALTEWNSAPAPVPSAEEAAAASPSEVIQPAAPESVPEPIVLSPTEQASEQSITEQILTPPIPEIPMEVTPEPRQESAVAQVEPHGAATPPVAKAPEPVDAASREDVEEESRHTVVVPLGRSSAKAEPVSAPYTPASDAALMHTLRLAAERGASTVYVVAQSKPMIRVDGEITPLESEAVLAAADVDRLVLELVPPRRRDALQSGPVEWLCDVPEIGRVRCLTFKDHRGPGILFRMFPARAISADQLGLTPEVQALCQQSDGLVLVTGARASGKSTLLNAFVDLINRTRSDHLITVETQIGFVHESRRSFISQRETRGDADLAGSIARAALHEDPDVMMIEDLKSPEVVSVALEAAESGRLVLASVPAASTIGALERLIDVFPADRRPKARMLLATALRGVVAQVLLRRVKGGQTPAREVLLNTPAVSTLVLEGKMFQLPVALDSGRRHGMVPLTDSLAAHVREGTVNVAEAYRKALDRAALLAVLKREGIDTSFAERLA
jgi:twitching motility protein PilT